MRYSIRKSNGAPITLPRELMEQLGHPEHAEVVAEDGHLVLRPVAHAAEEAEAASLMAALDRYRAALPAGIGFSEEELTEPRAASKEAEERENRQILAGFENDDLPA